MNTFIKRSWYALATGIIVLAISFSIFRALTPWASQYKIQIEEHLSEFLGQPVSIGRMETGWYWFEPILTLKNVRVHDGNISTLRLNKLFVGINLFSSLWHWQIQPGILYLDDVHLVMRQSQGKWQIEGLADSKVSVRKFTPEMIQPLVAWLALQQKLVLKKVSADLYFEDGTLMPVKNFNVNITNRSGHYRIAANASLDQKNPGVAQEPSTFELLGDVFFDPWHLNRSKGEIYISLQHLFPAQLQGIIPKNSLHFEEGQGNVRLWVDIAKGKFASVKGDLAFKKLVWHKSDSKNHIWEILKAQFGWALKDSGWRLSASKIMVQMGKTFWPENELQLDFTHSDNRYRLFVKSLPIASFLSEFSQEQPQLQKLKKINCQGNLSDTQIIYKEGALSYLLTRFDQVGWSATEALPEIGHLSGVLHWQPDEGRVEFDSINTLVAFKGYPAKIFDLLNGAFDWKTYSHGIKLSMERLVLGSPDLTLSSEGVFDGISGTSWGQMHVKADFSAKNLQQWLPYLPEKYLKAKLVDWLKGDVSRIAKASGSISVDGKAADFPFDDQSGDFKISSHLSGVELRINPQWPLIKDIDANLLMDKRLLDVDITQADFQGVPLKDMNLRIEDIGHDKEVLLIRGHALGEAKKMMHFVMHSPLNKKLSLMKMLTLSGPLDLDLRLQIPLYGEDEELFALGQLHFANNIAKVRHNIGDLELSQLSGQLLFDEQGITQSALKAQAFGYPFTMKIQSVKTPNSYTMVDAEGEFNIEELRKQYKFPLLERMKGQIVTAMTLKLTDDIQDMDHWQLESSLKGLAIDLPLPLGKSKESIKTLRADIDFNSQKAIRLRMNYDQGLSTDLWFEHKKENFFLHSGEIRIGNEPMQKQFKQGVRLSGSLPVFDLQVWKNIFEELQEKKNDSDLMSALNYIDLKIGNAIAFNNSFNDLTIKASRSQSESWSALIDQKNLKANVQFDPASNTVSGYVKQLRLNFPPEEKSKKDSLLEPLHIPNLNLTLDDVRLNNFDLGTILLKTRSTKNKLLLEYGSIQSPAYHMVLDGEWDKEGSHNQTKIAAKLTISDLARSLERFKIEPVVEADNGESVFRGEWPGSFFDFSLKAVKGQLYLSLKDGRITNLSPETEEKLGLGKLLSILSLQTIPRRLKLDFSDLSQKGYSFDQFKGDFNVSRGQMRTEESYIDGPVAYAKMKGELDLVKRLYDLELKITPHITASLPIVATIAGGPLAGVAAWIANKIINQGMQKIIAYTYKISGPWQKPVVQQVSIIKRKLKK